MARKPTYEELKKKLRDLEEKTATRNLLEKHRRDLDAQLQRNFAAGIAHDFNNLLMAVQANISLLLLDTDPSLPQYKRLTNIEDLIQNGARLTSRLLIQAKEEKFEIKSLNLNQLIEETVENFNTVQKKIPIHLDLDKNLYFFKANSSQIEQLIFNLLNYAADGMSKDGSLFISTANKASKNMTGKKYDPKPGNYVLMTFKARKRFISQEAIDRLFEPLLAIHEDKAPPDLSLASIYGTVKNYGGYVDIELAAETGTTFVIYFPAIDKKISNLQVTTEKFIKEQGTILLVDDEEAFLDVGRELLEALGYKVLVARNGREALKVFEQNREKIGMVLLDIVMPLMDGSETFDRLRQLDPQVKVLLASGYSEDGTAKEILARGCNGFIQKPFKMRDLSQKLTDIIVQP
jgi:two-component system cell cycle sensor histidine kinase/response regulator CckA